MSVLSLILTSSNTDGLWVGGRTVLPTQMSVFDDKGERLADTDKCSRSLL